MVCSDREQLRKPLCHPRRGFSPGQRNIAGWCSQWGRHWPTLRIAILAMASAPYYALSTILILWFGRRLGDGWISQHWPADAPCQRPLGTATISEISFGICSRRISSETARELHVFHFIDQEFPAKIALVRSPGARNLWIAGKRQRSREPQIDPRGAFLGYKYSGSHLIVCWRFSALSREGRSPILLLR